MWNRDTATSNAMYVVVYRDIEVNGIPIRSEPVSAVTLHMFSSF